MNKDLTKGDYEVPEVVKIGTVHELTLQNYPAAGQDDATYLLGEGFGS
jgi:hypothetical protein